jgi:hypothetical protein
MKKIFSKPFLSSRLIPVMALAIILNIASSYCAQLHAQVFLRADGPGNTYELINSVLGGEAVENPECAHGSFGRHITEAFDSELNKNVFIFHSHVAEDNDRCINFDRQRIEIKTYGPSPANVKGSKGETHTYRWKFRLDAGFQPSSSFTHIFQIKAGDGSDDGSPLITLTPRAGSPQVLQVIFTPSSGGSGGGVKQTAPLSGFKGVWVEAYVKARYDESGSIEVVIKRMSDGATLLSYSNSALDMWRGDATFNRPKWGIYRSLNNASALRNEQVKFADFCIAEGSTACPSDAGGGNTPPTASITSPASGSTFVAPATINIAASATDANGSVTKVEFFNGSTKLGEDTSSPYNFSWTNVAAGSYTLTARATDNNGATTTSSGVNITVNPCQAVIASADDGNVAANVLDNNLNTRWSASGDPQWIQFCLGSPQTVSGVKIAFYKGNERQAIFDVLTSDDASNWTTVISGRRSSGTSLALETFSFTARTARFVRIVGHGNNVNLWNSFTEVQIVTAAALTTSTTTAESTEARALTLESYPNPTSDEVIVTYNIHQAGVDNKVVRGVSQASFHRG